jgi:hypothetical protein
VQVVDYLPEVLSKFFAAYGLATIFDPLLVTIIDLIYGNYNCEARSDACKEDYTSNACSCFNGDFLKLWYRMDKEEGSGLTGLFIMILLYMGTGIIGCLLLYQYLVHVHRDGRILDSWRRINGSEEEFFMPLDFEVSDEELKAVMHKALHWRGPKGSKRRLTIEEFTEMDPKDAQYLEKFKKFTIHEYDANRVQSVFREFILEPSGILLENFDSRRANYQAKSIFHKDNMALEEGEEGEEDEEGGGAGFGRGKGKGEDKDKDKDKGNLLEDKDDEDDGKRSVGSRASHRSVGAHAIGSARGGGGGGGSSNPNSRHSSPRNGGGSLRKNNDEEDEPLLAGVGSNKRIGSYKTPLHSDANYHFENDDDLLPMDMRRSSQKGAAEEAFF